MLISPLIDPYALRKGADVDISPYSFITTGNYILKSGTTNTGYFYDGSDLANIGFSRNAYVSDSIWYRTDITKYSLICQFRGFTDYSAFQVYTSAPAANPITNWVKRFEISSSGVITLGIASTDVITCIARLIPRSIANDPTTTATAGSLGEIVFFPGANKWYGKTVADGTDTNWVALN